MNLLGKAYDYGYSVALKLMFLLPPEQIHDIIMAGLKALQVVTPANRAMERLIRVHDKSLEQELFGVRFPAPLGLAAGFDKNAEACDVWGAIGFGYAEVGTVTPKSQPGNPAPRLFRLPADKAIINRMGFNNTGALEVAGHLRNRRSQDIIGINIGKNKTTENAVGDYRSAATVLGPLANFLVVNVSSPNTPGLRDLQTVESLRPILQAVKESTSTPTFVKIAPDLENDDIDAIADLAVELNLAGIIATNTTIARDGLATPEEELQRIGAGGLSGAPLNARSLEVLERLHDRTQNRLILVAVGGITNAEQAWERIAAGASLLQGFTPLIYGGPGWIRRIHAGLAAQLRKQGMKSITDAVGCGLAWKE